METACNVLTVTSIVLWLCILLLPWRPWSTRESLDAPSPAPGADLGDVTALVPARNEAGTIGSTIRALKTQGKGLQIIVVDDQSEDETVEATMAAAEGEDVRIIPGHPLPRGWTGKLWALEQGRRAVQTPLILLLDADIELRPGILNALKHLMKEKNTRFVSLMAHLRMEHFWERLLMPAFVYFFKLLYPFQVSNSKNPRIAAAAGGCILTETRILEQVGGFGSLMGELIDDCALAKKVKALGVGTWIGLTHSAVSTRPYGNLGAVWNMVARTAFTQLRYSMILLLLCTAALVIAFLAPLLGLGLGPLPTKGLSALAIIAMMTTYRPTLGYYGIPMGWVLTLPLSGTLYLAMTWTSAVRYWQGKRSQWKGRTYTRT